MVFISPLPFKLPAACRRGVKKPRRQYPHTEHEARRAISHNSELKAGRRTAYEIVIFGDRNGYYPTSFQDRFNPPTPKIVFYRRGKRFWEEKGLEEGDKSRY